jgi:hypothetical protein
MVSGTMQLNQCNLNSVHVIIARFLSAFRVNIEL